MGRSHQTLNITIGENTLNQVRSFKYLKDRNVPKKAKQITHQTILRPMLIFGCECWTLTKRLEQQITTANMKVIRMIQGVTRRDRKRNEDLYKHRNMLPIVQVITKNILRWFGHVMRRQEDSTLVGWQVC